MPKTAKRRQFERARRITVAQQERRRLKHLHDDDPGWCRACDLGFKDASALANHRRGAAHKATIAALEVQPSPAGTMLGYLDEAQLIAPTFVGVADEQARHQQYRAASLAAARALGRA